MCERFSELASLFAITFRELVANHTLADISFTVNRVRFIVDFATCVNTNRDNKKYQANNKFFHN